MTVETQPNKAFFTADGVVTAFFYTYRLLRAADLEVYVDEVLVDPGLYTVVINTNGVGGSVTFTVAPGSIPTPVRGLIYRYVDYTQETHLPTESDFDQKSVENSLDKLTMEVQQLQEQINRAALLSLFDESGAVISLPPPSSRRALLWHPDEDGRLINSTYDPDELFNSTSALLVTMTGYLADALAAQVAAEAAQAAAEAAKDDAEDAAGTATTASGNYNTYFPTLVGPPVETVGDMLVWQEIAPSVFGYGLLNPGSDDQVLTVDTGFPTWKDSAALPPVGSDGDVLTTVSGAPAWAAGGAPVALGSVSFTEAFGSVVVQDSVGVVSVVKTSTGNYVVTTSHTFSSIYFSVATNQPSAMSTPPGHTILFCIDVEVLTTNAFTVAFLGRDVITGSLDAYNPVGLIKCIFYGS